MSLRKFTEILVAMQYLVAMATQTWPRNVANVAKLQNPEHVKIVKIVLNEDIIGILKLARCL